MNLLPEYSLTRPDTVHVCDALTLLRSLPDESVDAVITDPPYPKEYLPLYEMLAAQARRVLKPGGSLLAMCGQSYLPDILTMMTPHLRYHWMINYLMLGGQSAQIWPRKVINFWKPVLWFVSGDYTGAWVSDVIKSAANDKHHHHWGQSISGMNGLIDRFTRPGDLILDPFAGSGTTLVAAQKLERHFIGCDISPDYVAIARKRLAEPYMLPLFAQAEAVNA